MKRSRSPWNDDVRTSSNFLRIWLKQCKTFTTPSFSAWPPRYRNWNAPTQQYVLFTSSDPRFVTPWLAGLGRFQCRKCLLPLIWNRCSPSTRSRLAQSWTKDQTACEWPGHVTSSSLVRPTDYPQRTILITRHKLSSYLWCAPVPRLSWNAYRC